MMRRVSRFNFRSHGCGAAALLCAAMCGATAYGQPLVTGDLTLYYDFDEIVTVSGERRFLDESGNNLFGTIKEGDPTLNLDPSTVTLGTGKRGAGSVTFTQSDDTINNPEPTFVDVHGDTITANNPELLPRNGFTLAAWVNVTKNNEGDQSIFQGRTDNPGHGAPHFQLQGNGKLRITYRTQDGRNVVDRQVFINGDPNTGDPYPAEQWFHYAATYDRATNTYGVYYNGAKIDSGLSAAVAAGEELGNWGGAFGEHFAAGFGAVYDSGSRRFQGMMDELYVFRRALTDAEVLTLFNVNPTPTFTADFDDDGDVDGADYTAWESSFGANGGGDTDGDGDTDGNDFLAWQQQHGSPGSGGGASGVPEPASMGLFGLTLAALAARRNRRA